MIRAIATEIAVTSRKIAVALVILYVFGTLVGCGGSDANDDGTDKDTLPVGCVSTGCAK